MNLLPKIDLLSGSIVNFLISFLVVVILQISALANHETSLDRIKQLWQQERFQEVFNMLLNYRENHPNGKNVEIDYMIATTACRIPEERQFGRKALSWIKFNYQLSEKNLKIINKELNNCQESSASPFGSITIIRPQVIITNSRVSGKDFFNPINLPVNNTPVTLEREIPLEELASRLFKLEQRNEAIQSVQNRLDSNYRVVATGSFVLASSSHTETQLENIGKSLERTLSLLTSQYNMKKPSYLITVYPIENVDTMKDLSKKIHGIVLPSQSIAYSIDEDLSIVGEAPTQGVNLLYGTLLHELCHLVVHQNFGDIPSWMDEGIASLYEVSSITSNDLRGIPNWRGKILKRFWLFRPSITEMARMDSRSFANAEANYEATQQAVNYATSRYFFLYLQEQDLLVQTFTAFRNRNIRNLSFSPDLDASKLLESVLGKSLEEVDRDFEKWFNTLDHH